MYNILYHKLRFLHGQWFFLNTEIDFDKILSTKGKYWRKNLKSSQLSTVFLIVFYVNILF